MEKDGAIVYPVELLHTENDTWTHQDEPRWDDVSKAEILGALLWFASLEPQGLVLTCAWALCWLPRTNFYHFLGHDEAACSPNDAIRSDFNARW